MTERSDCRSRGFRTCPICNRSYPWGPAWFPETRPGFLSLECVDCHIEEPAQRPPQPTHTKGTVQK